MNPKTLARLNARAEQDRAGYPGPIIKVVSTPIMGRDGKPQTWGHNPDRPGPLDGKPRQNHSAVGIYSDGYTVTIGPAGVRTGKWRGGVDNV